MAVAGGSGGSMRQEFKMVGRQGPDQGVRAVRGQIGAAMARWGWGTDGKIMGVGHCSAIPDMGWDRVPDTWWDTRHVGSQSCGGIPDTGGLPDRDGGVPDRDGGHQTGMMGYSTVMVRYQTGDGIPDTGGVPDTDGRVPDRDGGLP